MNFESYSQNGNTPKPTASKKKGFLIATVIAVAVLVVAVIIMAIVLGNRYLEKVRGFYPVEEYSFNGYEIVNDDGLFYLTKDGKKVSREGYTMLVSLSAEGYKDYSNNNKYKTLASAPDVKIYDYFLARKEDSNSYFLIDGEGEELMIDGENWGYAGTLLPFVCFRDSVTGEYGVLSLENLDSDISEISGETLLLSVFDEIETKKLGKKNVLAGAIVLKDSNAGVDSPKHSFVDANGEIMFTSVLNYETKRITTDDGSYADLVLTSGGELYSLSGSKLQDNVSGIEKSGDCVIAYKEIEDEISDIIVYSQNGSFSISDDEYALSDRGAKENIAWVKKADSNDYTLFNLTTGEKSNCKSVSVTPSYVVCKTSTEDYNYVDASTGKTVLVSDYNDMTAYQGYAGVLYSPNKGGNLVLHFVASGKTAATKTLYANQTIEQIFNNNDGGCAYIITNTDDGKKTVYAPFASNPETKTYDKIDVIDAFAEGAPIAVATSFDSNEFKFIDTANSKIVYSISPSSAEKMAMTSVEFVSTYVLFADYDEGVELAVFRTVETDNNSDVVCESYYAFSREAVMTGGEAPASTDALVMTELGDNVQGITAPTSSYYTAVDASKYMIVQTSVSSSDVYEVTADYEIEKLSTVPYGTVKTVKFGDALDGVYLKVSNGHTSEYALYTVGGEMILGFHSGITVSPDGKYIIAMRNGVYGAYKYDAEKGRIKQMLDFEFASIQYMGDGGFFVQNNYDEPFYLYDERSLAKSDPVANIISSRVISWDEEAEMLVISKNTYYNIAGKLYVHRGEAVEIVDTTVVGSIKIVESGRVSYSPTLVNFYDSDGILIERKVIYPTEKSKADFKASFEGDWYKVSTKDLQDYSTKASAESIANNADGSGGVINVYKENTEN